MAVRAPAFEEGLTWFNSAPLRLSELKGRFVLLEFFTFGCVNCLNNIETIKRLHAAFGHEVTVIGVHTGKFSHEKESQALTEALQRYEIDYAVVNDTEHIMAKAYAVKGWPTTILIDNRGYLVHEARGEQKFYEWSGRFSSCGFSARRSQERESRPSDILYFPQKILTTPEFLAVVNTGCDEVWLCDYEGNIFDVISVISPMGMVYQEEMLYICEATKGRVVRYDLKRGGLQGIIDGLRNPYDLSIINGALAVAVAGSHQIYFYDLQSHQLLQTYGNKFEALRDGDAENCQLAQPSGLSALAEILYFVDAESSSLRQIESGVVTTLIGEGLFSYGDSNEGTLMLQHPQGLCAGLIGDGCGGGRLFIADTYNNKLKAYFPDDNSMMTLLEGLHEPSDVAKKGCRLYVTNTNAHEVVIFDLSSMQKSVMTFQRS